MSTEDFGTATYVAGRHQKNKVLVYTSRSDRNKVYEFMIATKYKIPGLVSWKCVSCSKLKNGYRNLGAVLKRKVPLILVDNDVIKEDPEKPLNAEHFCNGKDAVDAVLDRARIEFVHRHGNEEPNNEKIRETIHQFAREAAAESPIPLSLKEKRHVQRTLDMNCLPLLHGVKKRRRCKQRKEDAALREDSFSDNEVGPSTSNGESRTEAERTKETPRKKAKRQTKTSQVPTSPQQPLLVRPLPPHGCRPPYSPPKRLPPNPNTTPYYEMEEIVVDDLNFDNEVLISADQQEVSYNIEL